MKEMTTAIAALDTEAPSHGCGGDAVRTLGRSEDLLAFEPSPQTDQVVKVQHALRVLAVLEQMCESFGPDLLKNTRHMLEFCQAALQRCVDRLQRDDDESRIPGVLETETLTMAISLLAALITGEPKKQLEATDKQILQDILPLLQTVTGLHAVEPIQRLAEDLAISIATHGAVSSQSVCQAADGVRKPGGETRACRTKLDQMSVQSVRKPGKRNMIPNTDMEFSISARNGGCVDGDLASVGDLPGEDRNPRACGVLSGSSSDGSEAIDAETRRRQYKDVCGQGGISDSHDTNEASSCAKGDVQTVWKRSDQREQDDGRRLERNGGDVKNAECSGLSFCVEKAESGPLHDSVPLTSSEEGEQRQPGSLPGQTFEAAFQDLEDPLLPVRGHGLIVLGRLLRERDPKALAESANLLKIFEENLADDDTYIYLPSINGLVALSGLHPDRVMAHLCRAYTTSHAHQSKEKSEACRERAVEKTLKLGEALVKATRQLGELVPHFRDLLLSTILTGAKHPDGAIRASSLSHLGELCVLLRFALGSVIHEVLDCVTSLMRTDPEIEVKRSSVHVLTQLLKGLGKDAIQVLDATLRDVYRCLKHSRVMERDDILGLHIQLALEELDVIMRDYLFPETTLSKKITVLNP